MTMVLQFAKPAKSFAPTDQVHVVPSRQDVAQSATAHKERLAAADPNDTHQGRPRSRSPYKDCGNGKSVMSNPIAHASVPCPGNSVTPGTVPPGKGDNDPGTRPRHSPGFECSGQSAAGAFSINTHRASKRPREEQWAEPPTVPESPRAQNARLEYANSSIEKIRVGLKHLV